MAAGQDTEVCWDTVGKGPGDLDRTVRKRKLTVSNLCFYTLKTSQILPNPYNSVPDKKKG